MEVVAVVIAKHNITKRRITAVRTKYILLVCRVIEKAFNSVFPAVLYDHNIAVGHR